MTISSPAAARSTSLERFVFASYRLAVSAIAAPERFAGVDQLDQQGNEEPVSLQCWPVAARCVFREPDILLRTSMAGPMIERG